MLHSPALQQLWKNLYGQLGNGEATNSHIFVQVVSGGATDVAAGAFHSMVLMQDGSIRAMGSNKDGQLGNGSKKSEKTVIALEPFDNGGYIDTSIHVLLCYFITTMQSTAGFVVSMKSSSTVTGRKAASDGMNLLENAFFKELI